MAVVWGRQLVFDMTIFLLTLIRSLRIRREGSLGIVNILLRDGVYFERDFPLGLINRLLPGSMYFAWAEVEKTNHDADSFTVG